MMTHHIKGAQLQIISIPQQPRTGSQTGINCLRDVVGTPFFIAKLFSRWDPSSAPAPGRCCVLERLQSLVSGPTSPRTNDEEDNLVFISLLRAASTLGPNGGSNFLL